MRILVTRPEPGAAATAERLRAMGHVALCDPMLRIEDTGTPPPDGPFDALAFTSPNGARALAGYFPGLPAFAVGSRTALQARAAGFDDVIDCAGDAADLARTLSDRLPPGARVLHAAGEDRAADLTPLLTRTDIAIVLHIAYRAPETAALTPSSQKALTEGTLDAALHFSPRTVRALLRCVADAGLMEPFGALRHLCLSEAVAAPLLATGYGATVAARPDEDALLDLLRAGSHLIAKVAPGGPPV